MKPQATQEATGREPEWRAIIRRMEARERALTPEERARRRDVLRSVQACQERQEREEREARDPAGADLAILRGQALETYKAKGWPGVGHVLACAVGKPEQAGDFAEVAERYPKHFWQSFEALYRDYRTGKAKGNPAGWLRVKSRAQAEAQAQ